MAELREDALVLGIDEPSRPNLKGDVVTFETIASLIILKDHIISFIALLDVFSTRASSRNSATASG